MSKPNARARLFVTHAKNRYAMERKKRQDAAETQRKTEAILANVATPSTPPPANKDG